jgi:nicotinamide mononucleotide adenylyltransferase
MDINTIEQKFVPYIRPGERGGRTAFTVMACQPLHIGHVRVINRMILDSKVVIIGLEKAPRPSMVNAPYSDGHRIKMLHNVYGNRVRVVVISELQGGSNESWPNHCIKAITSEGWPEPTDYYTGSEADASRYAGWFWNKMVTSPELETKENQMRYFIDVGDKRMLRRLCLLREDFRQIPSSSEVRKLLQSTNKAWHTWVPAVNHHLVESALPATLRK